MNGDLSVLLVDDHTLFRAGLAVLLKKVPAIGEIAECGSGAEALAHWQTHRAMDLMILDIGLPDADGLDLLRSLKSSAPELPVILLSANLDAQLIHRALREHASGFIPKTATPEVMVSAVQLVLNGGVYIPPEAFAAGMLEAAPAAERGEFNAAASPAQLTQRQMDVLRHMKNGLSNKEIARELNMSPSTVKVHVAAILREFDAASRTQAVFLAKDRGVLD